MPPPFTISEWKAISGNNVSKKGVVKQRVSKGALSHSDGAPVYNTQLGGVLHDSVSHSRRRGQKKPQFTNTTTHVGADGKTFESTGGTQ